MSSDGRLWGWTGTTWVPMKIDANGRMVIDQPIGGGGAVSWKPSQILGLVFSTKADLGRYAQSPAFAVDAARHSGRIAQTPALMLSTPTAVGTAKPAENPALAFGARISDFKLPETPAMELVQVRYDLTRRVGGNAQAAVGTAWTNPANTISGTNGVHDAVVATVAGSVGGSTNGIELNYLNHVGKGELVITAATLYLYAAVTGDTTGLLSDTVVSYNIGAGLVQLEAIAGNFASLTTPRAYSLPLLDSWAEYDALAARVVQVMAAASIGVTASLDAIEIEIVASRTDSL